MRVSEDKPSRESASILDLEQAYVRYKPKVKIYSFFFLILPWFNLALMAFAYVYFSHALSIVPGEKVQLPTAEQHSGLRSGFIITARPIFARDAFVDSNETQGYADEFVPGVTHNEALPAIIVFFNDERFNLSIPHRYAGFEAKLRDESIAQEQKNALIYADKNISLGDAMKLMNALRNAGLEEICFVEDSE